MAEDTHAQATAGVIPFHRAVRAGDAVEWPALHSTAKADHTEIAELLRQYGATE